MDWTLSDKPIEPPQQETQPSGDPMQYVMGKLQSYGWHPEAAAGIAGNLYHESGLNTRAWGDKGTSFGLGQWNSERRKSLADYATQMGKPADDIDLQLSFLNHELLNDYSGAANALRNAKTPEEAAKLFSQHYEKPGTPMMGSRISAAKRAYSMADIEKRAEATAATVPPAENKGWTLSDTPTKAAPSGWTISDQPATAKPPEEITPETIMAGAPEAGYIEPIGAMWGEIYDIPFKPLHLARDIAIKALQKVGGPFASQEVPLEAVMPEILAGKPEGTGITVTQELSKALPYIAEQAVIPAYLKGIVKGGQLLDQFGVNAFYRHAPQWMFPRGKGGLPVPLSADEVFGKLSTMSGPERAEMARKYPQFRDVLDEMTSLISKEREPFSPEVAARVQAAREGLPAPEGMGETFRMTEVPPEVRLRKRPAPTEPDVWVKQPTFYEMTPETAARKGVPYPPEYEVAPTGEVLPRGTKPEVPAITPGETQKIVETAPQTRSEKITEHEGITGQTKVNDMTYANFVDLLQTGEMDKARTELANITANFSKNAFDHHFNPLNIMGRLVDAGVERQAAKELVRIYEKEVFKPVRGALEAKPPAPPVAPEARGEAVEGGVPGDKEFRAKFGSKQGKPQGLVTPLEEQSLAMIIKAHGGFNPTASIIKNFSAAEQAKIRLFSRKDAQYPDELLQELKGSYPHLFGEFETDADLLRAIVDKTVYKKWDADTIEAEAKAHYEREAEEAARGRYSAEDIAADDEVAKREVATEILAESGEKGGAESWPDGLTVDNFWDNLDNPDFKLTGGKPKPSAIETRLNKLREEYPQIDRERATTVLKAFPDAENDQIANMIANPEMFNRIQASKGDLSEQVKTELLRRANDRDKDRLLPMGGEDLFSQPTSPKGKGLGEEGSVSPDILIAPARAVIEDTTTLLKNAPENFRTAGEVIKDKATRLWDYYRSPIVTRERNYHQILGDYLGERQIHGIENDRYLKTIVKTVPNKVRREAIVNWIQAAGDEAVLRERADASIGDLKKGYEAALNLSAEEKAIAQEVSAKYDYYLQEAQAAGIIEHGLENYVNQMWKRNTANKEAVRKFYAEINAGLLNTNFKYAKKRIFDNYFEGEKAGYTPANKDIAYLLGHYDQSMYEAIAARRAIKALSEGVADDGRPLVAPHGKGGVVGEKDAPEAYLIRPKGDFSEAADGRRYRVIDHPALRKWKWVGKDPDGAPIYLQGDLAVHPDIYRHLNNVLKKSALQEYAVGRAALKGSQNLKGVLLSGLPSGFHQVHLGSHAVFHKINPFTTPPIDFSDPVQRLAVKNGLMVYNHNALAQFAEGLHSTGLAAKIPGIGRVTQMYGEYLFQDLIPRLKMKLFKEAFERNKERYAGKYDQEQIAEITANQSNAAFGELNYKAMGRNPTMQDMFRLLALAPDFLEARFRFLGQALKPGGREQLAAMLRAVIGMYGAGVIANMLLSDDHQPHWEKPFTLVIGKNAYSLRSIPGDMIHLINDPRSFAYHRLNPTTSRTLIEFLTARDVYGRLRNWQEQVGDFFRTHIPIPIQGQFSQGERTMVQSALQSVGISSYKYKTGLEDVIREYKAKYAMLNLSPEDKERGKLKKQAQDLLRDGKPDEAIAKVEEAIKGGKVDVDKGVSWLEEAINPAVEVDFKKLPIDWASKAMLKATPEEYQLLMPILVDKIDSAKPQDLEKAMPFLDKLLDTKSQSRGATKQ